LVSGLMPTTTLKVSDRKPIGLRAGFVEDQPDPAALGAARPGSFLEADEDLPQEHIELYELGVTEGAEEAGL